VSWRDASMIALRRACVVHVVSAALFCGLAFGQSAMPVVPRPGSAIPGAYSEVQIPGSAAIPRAGFDGWGIGGHPPHVPPMPYGMPYSYMMPFGGVPYVYGPPLTHSYYQHGMGGMNVIRAGHIHLIVDPVDARVYIDGYKVMQRPDRSYTLNLLEGRHRLQVVREGCTPYDHPLDVPGGGGLVLEIRLER